MSDKKQKKTMNEHGSMLIIVVIIIMVLMSLGIYGLTSTNIEIASSTSERRDKTNFANADTAMKFATANFELIYNNEDNAGGILYSGPQLDEDDERMAFTMTAGGVITSTDVPSVPATPLREMTPPLMALSAGGVDFNFISNGVAIARIEIKAIMLNPVDIASFSTKGNNVPRMKHLSLPPSGYDSGDFKSRNYCITSTALDAQGNETSTSIQCGVLMPAMKKNVDFLEGL